MASHSDNDIQKAPLRGVVPPMLTPLNDSDRLDIDGLERLIEHMLNGGIHGLFILGTTGEAASLTANLRRELIQRTCKQVANRIPVLVGVTDTSIADSLEMARYAAGVGANAAVISAPYYIPLAQRELVHYVNEIAAEQPLPIMLYNIPQLTKTAYEISTLQQLVHHPRIIGIKDSCGGVEYLNQAHAIFAMRPELSVLVGSEKMMVDAVQRGIHGAVPGGANIHPRLFVKLYNAAVAGDVATIARLQEKLVILGNIYRIENEMSGIIKALKCAMGHMRICSERMADPYLQFSVADRKKVRDLLESIDLAEIPTNAKKTTAIEN